MKYEQVLVANNDKVKKRLRLGNEIAWYKEQQVRIIEFVESSQRLIVSSCAPPLPTSLIVEIPNTPLHEEYTTKEDMEEEKVRLKAM